MLDVQTIVAPVSGSVVGKVKSLTACLGISLRNSLTVCSINLQSDSGNMLRNVAISSSVKVPNQASVPFAWI